MAGNLMRSSFWMKTRTMDLDSCYFQLQIYWLDYNLYLFPCYHKSEKGEWKVNINCKTKFNKVIKILL